MPNDVGSYRLRGAAAIAKFIGESVRRTYWLCETDQIPVGRYDGREYIASRKQLTEHYERLMRGQVAPSAPPDPPKRPMRKAQRESVVR